MPPKSFARVAVGLPSLNFLLLCLLFSGSGAAMAHGLVGGRFVIFVFVVSGWVVSLCLHEFAHAWTAWRAGDRSIPATGYLTLDPMRYADPVLSILLPLIYVALGGFGLPGGAVWINYGAIRGRLRQAAVAAAGPAANLAFLLALAGLAQALPPADATPGLSAALAALAFLQGTAIVLNLLPIPGLDGFGILRPFLPMRWQVATGKVAGLGLLILFAAFLIPGVGGWIFRLGVSVALAAGFRVHEIVVGYSALRLF